MAGGLPPVPGPPAMRVEWGENPKELLAAIA